MANVFKPKRSSTASSVPTTSDLSDGEIAVNSADKKIYLRDGASIIEVANDGSSGTTSSLGIIASGHFSSAGATVYADGISCSRTSTGVFVITFGSALANTNYTVAGQVIEGSTRDDIKIHVVDGTKATTGFTVSLYEGDNGGTADVLVDRGFFVTVIGTVNYATSIWSTDGTDAYRTTGSVGIGTDNPTAKLDVKQTNSDTVIGKLKGSASTAYLNIEDSTTTSGNVAVGAAGNDLLLRAGNSNHVRLNFAGNLGIGTFNPTAKLDVRGSTSGQGSGTGTGEIIAKFVGDSDGLEIRNISAGDYGIYNSGLTNGIEFLDGLLGTKIIYNGNTAVEFDSGNNYGDFKGTPSVNGDDVWHAGNDGSGSGLDADTVDGIQADSFLRSDAADVSTGNIAFNGTLASFDPPGGGAGTDTATDVAIALASGHRIAGWQNGYIRTLFEWNVSGDIDIGQGGTTLIGGINLLPGSSGDAKVNGNTIWHAGNKPANYAKYVGTGTPNINNAGYTEVSWINTTPQFSNGTWSATSSHIVVPATGLYMVQVNFYITASVTRSNVGLKFAVNDVQQSEIAAHNYIRNNNGHNESSINMATTLSLSANDQVSIYTAQLANSGTVSLQGTSSTIAITQLA